MHFFNADTCLEEDPDDAIQNCVDYYSCLETSVKKRQPDYSLLKPYFSWLPTDIIKKTFSSTTQYARTPMSTVLKKNFKSPFPALNVSRRNEPVATDTVYSDTPAVDDGSTSAQIFVGTKTLLTDIYGMKSDKQFVNTLEDNIRQRGAMDKLLSDRAQVEISKKVLDILRALYIGDWQSEPHRQNQNPAERRYQNVKSMTNTLLDRTGAPAFVWLLAMMYICFVLNHAYNASIDNVPLNAATGSTCDISPLLRFRFWQPVYFMHEDSDFPSESKEERGRWVGISESVGHDMTFKILTDKTCKIIHRSNVRSANDPLESNIRLDPLTIPKIIKDKTDLKNDTELPNPIDNSDPAIPGINNSNNRPAMPIIDPADLVGRTFLTPEDDDGKLLRARIVKAIDDYDDDCAKDSTQKKFV